MNTCQLCGCTDAEACDGGCFWVFPRVCSACVFKAILLAAHELDENERWYLGNRLVELADAVSPQEQDRPELPELPVLWRPGDPL